MIRYVLPLALLPLAGCAAAPPPASLPAVPLSAEEGGAGTARTYLARIAALNDSGPRLNAVLSVNPQAPVLAQQAREAGLPLAGRTVLVKDNIETSEWPTTAGSLALADNRTGRDAPLIARLRQAGGVVLGKTNLSEWANIRASNSTSGWSALGGQTRNPHAIDRNPCGSSSGSGAAVAAGLAWAAIGTETNGSITCPASANGVVGFKPTVGLVSRTHIVPISASQDTAGPMARLVGDAALLLNAIAGGDVADSATAEADRRVVDFTSGLANASLAGVRIGVLRGQVGENTRVSALFEQAVADLEAAGAVLVDVDYDPPADFWRNTLPVLLFELREGMDAYLAGLPASGGPRSLAQVVAFNDANREAQLRWFGQDLFEQALTTDDTAAYSESLAMIRRSTREEGIDRLLQNHDVALLVAPTAGPAWTTDLVNGDNFSGGIGAGYLAAIAGYPHLTVPMGAVEALPVGLSIMGARWDDAAVLKAGAAYERARSAPLAEPGFVPWQGHGVD